MKMVAAYCRVSTDKYDQLNSLENQKRFFKDYIDKNEDWEFFNMYIDEGISGTSIKKRTGFKEMIRDSENKMFDILITKEISRFARNTLDSIYYTRKLKSLGIGIIFLNDNINTLDPDSELRLTLMASIAQEESRKISERVKWGQKRSMERGVAFGNGVYGYEIKGGKLFINENEAETIRLIYRLYNEEGMGTHVLAKELETRGIKTPSGALKWTNATLLKILKNEKYIGILKQKKEITTDFLSHSRKTNKGEEEYIVIENNHIPIIDKKIFDAAQLEIKRRSKSVLDKSKHSNRYAWSGKLECEVCGSKLKHKTRYKEKECKTSVWQCCKNIKYGDSKKSKDGCSSKAIQETVLEQAFLLVLKEIIKDKEAIINELEKAVKKAFEHSNYGTDMKNLSGEIEKFKSRKERLIDLYSDESISKQEFRERNDEYNKKVELLKKQLNEYNNITEKLEESDELLTRVKTGIKQLAKAEIFSEEICRQLINKVIIQDKNHFKFILNGNIEKQVILNK